MIYKLVEDLKFLIDTDAKLSEAILETRENLTALHRSEFPKTKAGRQERLLEIIQLEANLEDYLKKRERLENTIGTVRKYGANVLYQTGKLEKIRKEVTESSWPTTLQVYINRSFAFLIRYPQEERP